MFGPVTMNQRGIRHQHFPKRREPYMTQLQSQFRPNQAAINNRLFPSVTGETVTQSKGVGGLTKILDNTQQVLRMVETATPMIKEYGPMIKNLPAMYKMIKAFKDVDSFTDTKEGESKEDQNALTDDSGQSIPKELHEQSYEVASPTKKGMSTPKLYI